MCCCCFFFFIYQGISCSWVNREILQEGVKKKEKNIRIHQGEKILLSGCEGYCLFTSPRAQCRAGVVCGCSPFSAFLSLTFCARYYPEEIAFLPVVATSSFHPLSTQFTSYIYTLARDQQQHQAETESERERERVSRDERSSKSMGPIENYTGINFTSGQSRKSRAFIDLNLTSSLFIFARREIVNYDSIIHRIFFQIM